MGKRRVVAALLIAGLAGVGLTGCAKGTDDCLRKNSTDAFSSFGGFKGGSFGGFKSGGFSGGIKPAAPAPKPAPAPLYKAPSNSGGGSTVNHYYNNGGGSSNWWVLPFIWSTSHSSGGSGETCK